MRRWVLALLLWGVCWSAAPAQARVWSGVDLMHVESADGTNMCALTFDDGPAAYSPHLLDVLESEGIHATFFMLGRQVLAHPDIVRRVAQSGHDIGIHSQTHPNMKKLSMDRQAEELIRPLLALQELGIAPRWFRPPYGNMNASLKELAAYLGLSIVIWSHDSKDWKRTRSDYANMETATGAPTPEGAMRGVFLFHDTSARTAEELPEILNILRARGCQRFVTMSEFTGETERPMPSRQDSPLFVEAGQSLTRVLGALKQGPHGTGVELLSTMVAAVTRNAPLPDFAAAGLHTPPFAPVTAVAAAPASTASTVSAISGAYAPSAAPAAFAPAVAPSSAPAAPAVSAAVPAAAPALTQTAAVAGTGAPAARRSKPLVFRFAPHMLWEHTAAASNAGGAGVGLSASADAPAAGLAAAPASDAHQSASVSAVSTAVQAVPAVAPAVSSAAPVTPAVTAPLPQNLPVNAPARAPVMASPTASSASSASGSAPQLLASPVAPPVQ